MSFIAKLSVNGRSLDLNDDTFAVAESFVPPATDSIPLLASGTSANRRGGSTKVGQRANDISVTLPIYLTGSSEAEIQNARRQLASFMQYAGISEDKPLIFEWRGTDDISLEPIYGQYGVNLRYEITHTTPPKSWRWHGVADYRKKKELTHIKCLFKPYASGLSQVLATAKGGVIEDKVGQASGLSRGLIVGAGITNVITNPYFGHATWNTGWTNAANLFDTENTDPTYILFGESSAHLVTSSGAVTYTQSIDVGDTQTYRISGYVKKPDSSAVTVADCRLYYNGNLTTTYTDWGDGWYRLEAGFTGIASSQITGILVEGVKGGIYADGFQIEQNDKISTALCHGDMLGCAWAGTAHASSTTRTAGVVKLGVDDIINRAQGTIRIAVKCHVPSADIAADMTLFTVDATNDMVLRWDDSSADWLFTDGTQTVESTGETFSAGDIVVLHCVYGPSGLALYIDGSVKDTDSSYSYPLSPTSAYIGSTAASAGQPPMTFMDLATYDREMTATEISDDYDALSPILDNDQRLAPIPWLWTKDGDDITDNCNDSTRDNYCVIGGIPGTAPAKTRFDLTRSFNATTQTVMSLFVTDKFLEPVATLFTDASGTPDGNSCGGEYYSTTPGAGAVQSWSGQLSNRLYEAMAGKEIRVFIRFAATALSGTLQVGFRYGNLTTSHVTSPGKTLTTTGTSNFRLHYSDTLILPEMSQLFLAPDDLELAHYYELVIDLPAGTRNLDYFTILPRPLLILEPVVATASGTQGILLEGARALSFIGTTPEAIMQVSGDEIELVPDQINMLLSLHGDTAADATVTYTMTYNEVLVTPRWEVA